MSHYWQQNCRKCSLVATSLLLLQVGLAREGLVERMTAKKQFTSNGRKGEIGSFKRWEDLMLQIRK